PRRQAKGPSPEPRWMPLPQLLYAQVVKTVRRRRLVRVRHRVVFGTLEAVQQVLTACGRQINTALLERLNLSLRQHVAAIGRRVATLWVRTAHASRRCCTISTTTSASRTPPYARLSHSLNSPTARAPPGSGGPKRPRWRRG